MKKEMVVLALLSVFLCASVSFALSIPTDLAFDFRDWVGANGQNNFSVGSVTAAANSNSKLSQGAFGLGVNSGGFDTIFGVNDEVDWGDMPAEAMTVTFSGGQLLNGFWLTNFFPNEVGQSDEKGKALVNGVTQYFFTANSSDGNFFLDFGGLTNVNSIVFRSDNIIGDYSVVGAAVPEPTTILLLGAGLIGLAGYGRKKLNK